MSRFSISAYEPPAGPSRPSSRPSSIRPHNSSCNGPDVLPRRGTNRRRRDPAGLAKPLALVLTMLLLAGFSHMGPAGRSAAAEPKSEPLVTLTIDYGDGFQKRYPSVPWVAKMTVLHALRHAERHPRAIKVTVRGSASTALLTQIDDLKNEGNGRNWIYRVNDKLGDRSFAIWPLQAGDQVLWRFETYAGE